MARKQFTISYPDGSKKNIGAAQREQLLLAGEIRQIGQASYAFSGQVKTYHSFADLQELSQRMAQPPNELRRFLGGQFIVVAPRTNKRQRELLETAEALALRLPQMVAKLNESVPVAGFEAAA